MKRATRIALVAVLCWLGLAQARILWGPRVYVEDVGSRTSDNNTWAVTGCGDTGNVGTLPVLFHMVGGMSPEDAPELSVNAESWVKHSPMHSPMHWVKHSPKHRVKRWVKHSGMRSPMHWVEHWG
jgi:hypothetical protein